MRCFFFGGVGRGGGGEVNYHFFHFLYAVIKRKSDNYMGFFQEYLMAL